MFLIGFINNIDLEIDVYFRECISGEITQNQMCIECPRGTYSFVPSKLSCDKCFDYGVCLGKNETEVIPGYWRSSVE